MMVFAAISSMLITLVLLISFYTYRTCFYSPRGKHNGPYEPMEGEQYDAVSENIFRVAHIMEQYPYESVLIHSYDNTVLHGRYYHLKDGAPLQILFHGYRSSALRDCSGGHALSRKMGFNALVIDQRAHGESDGVTITFGIRERRDCEVWVKYAAERFGPQTPIILSGLSMGAATVLMASDLELPNVVAIMADSPYSAPIAIIMKVCQDLHYPTAICKPFIYLGAWLYGHFHLGSCCAKDAVCNTKIPILLIHGEDDRLVPCDMSSEIKASCASRAEVHTFPGAGHGLCYITDPVRYERVIFDFLRSIPQIADTIDENYIQIMS